MTRLNTKNNNWGLSIVWIAVSLAVILSSCRTTSYSKNKKGRSRILEQRQSVPHPYQEPAVMSQKEFVISTPSKSTEIRTPVTKQLPANTVTGWTAINPSSIKGPIIEKEVFHDDVSTIKIPPAIIDEKVVTQPIYEKKVPPPKLSVAEPELKLRAVEPTLYTVTKGDTLWDISQLYGVSVHELASENNMKKKDILAVGTVLTIPAGGTYRPPSKNFTQRKVSLKKTTKIPSKKIRKRPIPTSGKYTIEKGDNLWEISQTFGISLQKLKEINGLNNSDLLHPGQIIVLVESKSTPSSVHKPLATPIIDPPEIISESKSENTNGEDSGEQTEADVSIHIPDIDRKTPSKNTSNKEVSTSSTIDLKNLPHYISAGDTLESIAEMYGSEVQWILEENPEIHSNDDLAEGIEIQVPCPDIE